MFFYKTYEIYIMLETTLNLQSDLTYIVCKLYLWLQNAAYV